MITRSLVFYRWQSENTRAEFVPHEVATRLAAETVHDPEFAVLRGQDVTTAVTVVDPGSKDRPTRLQLMALRTEDQHPSQWQPGGRLGLLPVRKGHYPADVTHVTVWPTGFASQDLHKNAPRLGRLSFFIRTKVREYISFDPLYNPRMYEKLLRMRGTLRSIEIGITKPEYADRDMGILETFLPSAFGPRAPSLRVKVGMGRYGPRNRYLDENLEEVAFAAAENAHELVDALIISGFDPTLGKVDTINFLKQRLKRDVELPRSSDVPSLPDADAAFDAMASAYQQLTDDGTFEQALRAQVVR